MGPRDPHLGNVRMTEAPLPLWNEDETDVLPEYQLGYVHALIHGVEQRKIIRGLEKVFPVTKVSEENFVSPDDLPWNEEASMPALQDDDRWHCILAISPIATCVFGPHRIFLGGRPWMALSRKLKARVFLVARLDAMKYSYHLYRDGKHRYVAFSTPSGVRVAEEAPVVAHLNGKKIFEYQPDCVEPSEEERAIIHEDVVLKYDPEEGVHFEPVFPSLSVAACDTVLHAVFRKSKWKEWWKSFLSWPK